jgi:hypothetical protein
LRAPRAFLWIDVILGVLLMTQEYNLFALYFC